MVGEKKGALGGCLLHREIGQSRITAVHFGFAQVTHEHSTVSIAISAGLGTDSPCEDGGSCRDTSEDSPCQFPVFKIVVV